MPGDNGSTQRLAQLEKQVVDLQLAGERGGAINCGDAGTTHELTANSQIHDDVERMIKRRREVADGT